jgi:opacity protein-like surface antigen
MGGSMKKIFSTAVSLLMIATASQAIAGSKGSKYVPPKGPAVGIGCPDDCQDQIDHLNSSQARQDEQINALRANQSRQDGNIRSLQAGQEGLRQGQERQGSNIRALKAGQDALRRDQGRQDAQINANTSRLNAHEHAINALQSGRHSAYYPWYIKGVGRMIWAGSMDLDKEQYGFKADTDTGYGIGIAGGRKMGNFRAEVELATQKSDIKADGLSDVTIDTLMFNGFYHVPVPLAGLGFFGRDYCDLFSIYGMAGLGAGKVEVTFDDDIDASETGFAYKVGMGVAFDVAANMAIDLGYEYMRTSDVQLGYDHSLLRLHDMKNSSVNAAFRYSF